MVGIFAGRALAQRQCTLEDGAWYVNVWGSLHWEGVYNMGVIYWECKFFKFIIETDLSETPKSHMYNMSLKLTNHNCLMAK